MMTDERALLLPILAFMALLATGAVSDVRRRRIPDWVSVAIGVSYLAYVSMSESPPNWQAAVVLAGAVFAGGYGLFAMRALGGGDVKLMTAAALWAGPAHLPSFLLVTAIAGGALAALVLFGAWVGRRLPGSLLAGWGLPSLPGHDPARSAPFAFRRDSRALDDPETPGAGRGRAGGRATVPYGVAVALGGGLVALDLFAAG